MTPQDEERGREARRRRFRAQAWLLGGLAVAIYFGYLAFMIVKGVGGA